MFANKLKFHPRTLLVLTWGFATLFFVSGCHSFPKSKEDMAKRIAASISTDDYGALESLLVSKAEMRTLVTQMNFTKEFEDKLLTQLNSTDAGPEDIFVNDWATMKNLLLDGEGIYLTDVRWLQPRFSEGKSREVEVTNILLMPTHKPTTPFIFLTIKFPEGYKLWPSVIYQL